MPNVNLNQDGEFDTDVAVPVSKTPNHILKSKKNNPYDNPYLTAAAWTLKILAMLCYGFFMIVFPIWFGYATTIADLFDTPFDWFAALVAIPNFLMLVFYGVGGLYLIWWLWHNMPPTMQKNPMKQRNHAKR